MLEAAEDVAARTVRGAAQQEVGEDLLVAVRVQRVAAILGQTGRQGGLWVYWPFWDRRVSRVGLAILGQTVWVVGTGQINGGLRLLATLGQTDQQDRLWVLAILGQTDKQSGLWVLAILGQR